MVRLLPQSPFTLKKKRRLRLFLKLPVQARSSVECSPFLLRCASKSSKRGVSDELRLECEPMQLLDPATSTEIEDLEQ